MYNNIAVLCMLKCACLSYPISSVLFRSSRQFLKSRQFVVKRFQVVSAKRSTNCRILTRHYSSCIDPVSFNTFLFRMGISSATHYMAVFLSRAVVGIVSDVGYLVGMDPFGPRHE